MGLPPDHPQRRELNDEVHARPPEVLASPLRVSYLALLCEGPGEREGAWAALRDLARHCGAAEPAPGAIHHSAGLPGFRLRWEQHTEFYRVMLVAPGADPDAPFAEPALAAAPADWVASLPGRVVTAAHAALLRPAPGAPPIDPATAEARHFAGHSVVGASVAGGVATALTDFRIHPDGFGRILVEDRGMPPGQAGRIVQRLLEIETYRAMALLALPVARELAPFLARSEQELAEVATALVTAGDAEEAALLARLTRLAAEIESRDAATRYRFSAAAAYYALVERRIAELRERRIEGLSTVQEFTERRLAPAMSTCRAAATRQESLSRRVARSTQLLSTRVDITRQGQNQAVLESMNRRAKLQLRLQQTVEGLSVAAVTYYVVGLVNYLAKGGKAAGLRLDPDVVAGISIPVVAGLAALGIRGIRRRVTREAD